MKKNNKKFTGPDIALILVLIFICFIIDYSRVTACKGAAVYIKCHNYFGDE